MNYAEGHQLFIQDHLARRKGERRDRLERGHRHAEQLFLQQVWWPLMGSFQDLHPEYEVLDWHGRSYFADFCWMPGQVKLLIEIKGFQTHVRDMDRRKFSYELNRETFLLAMGFHVVSFSYDDVEQQPQVCQNLLRMVVGRLQTVSSPATHLKVMEREILRYAIQLARPLRPRDVTLHFQVDQRTAVRTLQSLEADGWLIARRGAGGKRVMAYALVAERMGDRLWNFFS